MEENIMTTGNSNGNVQKCLQILNSVKSDNDMFAALLLVTKVTKASECDPSSRRKIFEAIGFKFITRLLKSEKLPEGCTRNIYRAMAIVLLSCFTTDENLRTHSQMLAQVPAISDIILTDLSQSDDPESDKQMVCDCYELLTALAQSWQGRLCMVEFQTLSKLCEVYLQDMFGVSNALSLVRNIAKCCDEIPIMWSCNLDACVPFLNKMSMELRDEQSERKFELCRLLADVVPSLKGVKDKINYEPWSSDIFKSVMDSLQSRVGVNQRKDTLILVSAMIDVLGIEWINKDILKFMLTVNLTCVEIRMILEDEDIERVLEDQTAVIACFSILENVITYIANSPSFYENNKHFLQAHSIIKEAINAVLYFLKIVADQDEDDKYLSVPLVNASVRLLGSWLAVETNSLQKGVCDILPFLLKICKKSCSHLPGFPNQNDLQPSDSDICNTDILRFLAPALCHLSAETDPRRVFIAERGHELLGIYFRYQWQEFLKYRTKNKDLAQESQGVLTCICGIFMNLVILEPEVVACEPPFHDILEFISSNFSNIVGDPSLLVLSFNALVLGLAILRKQNLSALDSELISFLRNAVIIVKEAHFSSGNGIDLVERYKKVWDEISELWFLAVQEISYSMEVHNFTKLVDIVFELQWPQCAINLLQQGHNHKLETETKSAFELFLRVCLNISFADKSPTISEAMTGITDVAKIHGMKSLLIQKR